MARLNDEVTFTVERGGGPVLVGPELALLELTCAGARVVGAAFSHSLIEIMDEGRIVL